MKFEMLNQSIELNAAESPSLYNALNMVRSLFQDVEDAADASLSQCPLGDARLPLEMIWLSSELLSIYEDNTDALQRNRDRLDSVMEELRAAQGELEKIAHASKLLPEKEAEYAQLHRKLEAARGAQAAYEELLGKIAAAKTELAELKGFDFDAAQRQLDQLREESRQLKERIRTLDQEIQGLKETTAAAQRKLDEELLPEHGRLTQLKESLEQQKRDTAQQIRELTKETGELTEELARLRRELPQRERERDDAKQRVADYRRTEYDPVVAERDAHLSTEQGLQRNKAAVEQQIRDLKSNHQELILLIGRKKDQYDSDTKEYNKKKQQEEQLILDQEELTGKLENLTKTLGLRQKEYNKLHDEDLPAVESSLTAEAARLEKLNQELAPKRAEITWLSDESDRREAELPQLEKKLCDQRIRYEALRVTYTSKNQDILQMEQKIKDLEAENDQEKLDRYRIQLAAETEKLEGLAKECRRLDGEILELAKKVETANSNCRALEDQKRTKEEGLKKINGLLLELKPFDTPEYRQSVEKVVAQLTTLQTVRDNLAASIAQAYQCIVGPRLTDAQLNVNDLRVILQNAADYSSSVHEQLEECARALNAAMKEEYK